ncbi:MAG: hypothetical protein WEB09_01940 [Nitriliruptor sp.]
MIGRLFSTAKRMASGGGNRGTRRGATGGRSTRPGGTRRGGSGGGLMGAAKSFMRRR